MEPHPFHDRGDGAGKNHKTQPDGEELTEISAYLYFFKFFDEPGNPTRGRYLFNEKGCNSCHPLSGKGKEGEPGLDQFPQNISPIFLSQAIWNHGPVMIASMVKLGMKWPVFDGTEMMDLLEYIKTNAKGSEGDCLHHTGEPREGKQVFVSKGCIKCHASGAKEEREGRTSARGQRPFIKASPRSPLACGIKDPRS